MPIPTEDTIPMLDLAAEVEGLWPELVPAVERVLRSGRFILGPEVEAFEQEAAAFLGVRHAVGLNSGTDALVIGLRALGVEAEDEVITTSFSFFANAEAILQLGARPVYVDIRPDSFNLDPERLEQAVSPRTRAIVPVHLFGNPAAMGTIMSIAERHGLSVLEDCAQSFGARYHHDPEGEVASSAHLSGLRAGSIGHAGAISFYPTKALGAYGDGGLLVTDSEEIADTARSLRAHGAAPEDRFQHLALGYTSRLDALQAAILRLKLRRVDPWNETRRALAQHYTELLSGVMEVQPPAITPGHVFHQYTVTVPAARRSVIRRAMAERGVASMIYYPEPLYRTGPGAAGRLSGTAPRALEASRSVLSLPMWPGLTEASQERVVEALETALERVR